VKIAIVVPGGVDRSGEYRVIPAFLAVIEGLARRHQVHVFALHQESTPASWPLLGATVHNVGDGRTRLRAVAAIRGEHRRSPFDAIQALFSGSCGLIAVVAGRLLRRPSFVHVAGGELVSLPGIDYGGRRKWKGRWREAVVLRLADAVTAASAPIIDSLCALGIRAQRLPLGVDLRRWPARAPQPRSAGPARLIHVASINRVKDAATLLQALAQVAAAGVAFEADLVGVDTLEGEAMRLADKLGLSSQVRFLGFKAQRELRPLVEAADLLVMSSLHEAGPLVLLEAAVAGVPAVGTAVGHFVEWSPSACVAVPVGDAGAIAAAICRVLADEALRLRLAAAAQQRALVENAETTVRCFEDLYRRARA